MLSNLKILLLEDNKDDAFLVEREIGKMLKDIVSKRVDTKEAFIEAIINFEPNVILSDHALPQFSSIEAFEICKSMGLKIPFILITGTVSEEFAVDILKKGVDDYILKDNMIRLPSAIVNSLIKKQAEKDRNEAIEKLVESETHYRKLIENSSDIFSVIDADNVIHYINPTVKYILGYDPEELIGKNIIGFVHPDDKFRVEHTLRRALKNQKVNNIIFKFKHKDGLWYYIESIGKLDTEGKKIIVNSRNVTDRKLVEEELKRKNTELEKINRELDSFVYSASHDLRAPLKSVLGLVKLAQMDNKKGVSDFYVEYFSMMEKSIYKLDETIKEIIYHSKNGRSEIVNEKVDFKILIEDAYNNLKYLDKTAAVELRLSIDEDWPYVGDKGRLTVLFNNIISNSVKYSNPVSSKSYIDIEIKGDSDKVKILIEDNGIGISDKYLPKIFDMFYRATELSDGSGLGLYIVKEIVDKLKGSISVTSKVNAGTKFLIEIPNNLDQKI